MPKPYIPPVPAEAEQVDCNSILKRLMERDEEIDSRISKMDPSEKIAEDPLWSLEQTLVRGLKDKNAKQKEETLIDIVSTGKYGNFSKLMPVIVEFSRRVNEKLNAEYKEKKLEHANALNLTNDKFNNVYNWRFFSSALQDEIHIAQKYQKPFSIAKWDVDHFKAVNDTYGHDGGDFILEQMIERAYTALREEDILTREGGDEFIVIFPGADAKKAGEICAKVSEKVREKPIIFYGNEISITLSIGLNQYKGFDQKEFIRATDHFLYQAKGMGRDKVVGNKFMYDTEKKLWVPREADGSFKGYVIDPNFKEYFLISSK